MRVMRAGRRPAVDRETSAAVGVPIDIEGPARRCFVLRTVAQAMTEEVVRIDMDTRIEEIIERFRSTGFRHALVIEEGAAVGVISDRDVLRHVSPFVGKMGERNMDRTTLTRRAHQVMTRKLISVGPDSPAVEAAMLMHKHYISCVPVVNADGECVGIFTWRNAIAFAADVLGGKETAGGAGAGDGAGSKAA